jgi:hypothetical protein
VEDRVSRLGRDNRCQVGLDGQTANDQVKAVVQAKPHSSDEHRRRVGIEQGPRLGKIPGRCYVKTGAGQRRDNRRQVFQRWLNQKNGHRSARRRR